MADIITYPENGITYDADDASGYLATRLSGVYSAEEDFAVTAQGGLSVQVSAGQAWVRPGTVQGPQHHHGAAHHRGSHRSGPCTQPH